MDKIILGMSLEQLISVVTIILAIAGLFWKQRIENVKIKKDISANKQFCELKLAEIEKDILRVRVDLENHKDDNKEEFIKFIEQNREDHNLIRNDNTYIKGKLDNIIEHLMNK